MVVKWTFLRDERLSEDRRVFILRLIGFAIAFVGAMGMLGCGLSEGEVAGLESGRGRPPREAPRGPRAAGAAMTGDT
jgi:hypothetical protein